MHQQAPLASPSMGGPLDIFSDVFHLSGSATSPEDLFCVLDGLEDVGSTIVREGEDWVRPDIAAPYPKRARISAEGRNGSGAEKTSHIKVERNRRKQMNENLSMLRSLMPCFYVKRGDQASIIGGVIDYIRELQQLLYSLEAKKQRQAYCTESHVSPRNALPSPRLPQLSSMSPRIPSHPMSPRTPLPGSPYKPKVPSLVSSPSLDCVPYTPPCLSLLREIAPCSSCGIAEVDVKFAGPYLVVKTTSSRAPRQALKLMEVIERLPLEILHASVTTVEETMFNSFTIKIGIDCPLSAEELAQEIQKTFS